MKDHQLVVNVEDFRAVKKAELILDGITVVAGENGCGKSTLSKLLYYLFKTTNEYEYYVVNEVRKELDSVEFVMNQLWQNEGQRKNNLKITEDLTIQDYEIVVFVRINELRKIYSQEKPESNRNLSRRLVKILKEDIASGEDTISTNLDLLKEIEILCKKAFDRGKDEINKRPSLLFKSVLQDIYAGDSLPNYLHLMEFGESVYSFQDERISQIRTVETVSYVDTPVIVGIDGFENNDHWKDLNELLRWKKRKSNNGSLTPIQSKILDGDIEIDKTFTKRFIYKRRDGQEFDLMSCATGVKSFAILQLLYKNGHLNDKTLLIIDEPEVHLHPQWIVEYARLMVLLNKELGVKFFVASHNPDMVSAIKYIAEREQTDANLNFYLAEKEVDEFTYTYRHLGTEIDDIFGSFNIALERINQYGVQE